MRTSYTHGHGRTTQDVVMSRKIQARLMAERALAKQHTDTVWDLLELSCRLAITDGLTRQDQMSARSHIMRRIRVISGVKR